MRYFSSLLFVTLLVVFASPSFAKQQTVTISMTENGFEPREVAVEEHTVLVFVNKDERERWPASNIHPTHGIYPEFDPQKPLPKGSSWHFTITRAGTWRYHDHLLPHLKGRITVTQTSFFSKVFSSMRAIIGQILYPFKNNKINKVNISDFTIISPEDFRRLSQKERYGVLDRMMNSQGVEYTWRYVVDSFERRGNAHDLAHFVGSRIFETRGLQGLSICTPSFAFGCYHGFSEAAFTQNLDRLSIIEKACGNVGKVASGPWASCIHGIGHGIATFFDTVALESSLSACDTLSNGHTYCYDGVFMEFMVNAPKSIYTKSGILDPLYPCSRMSEKYKSACARSQPGVMRRHFGMRSQDVVKTCLGALDKTIQYHCIDALGLEIGQNSYGDPSYIERECGKIQKEPFYSQCTSAAAGEIVFQNYKGWEKNAPEACARIKSNLKKTCEDRINTIISSYRR